MCMKLQGATVATLSRYAGVVALVL
jgi:hypothetical protein